jgi:hypothetical protein
MTTHADVANLVANAIDGAEFLDRKVADIIVDTRESCFLTIEMNDGSRWQIDVLNLGPAA